MEIINRVIAFDRLTCIGAQKQYDQLWPIMTMLIPLTICVQTCPPTDPVIVSRIQSAGKIVKFYEGFTAFKQLNARLGEYQQGKAEMFKSFWKIIIMLKLD